MIRTGRMVGAVALAIASLACREASERPTSQLDAGCTPPPSVLTCPDAGSPNFATEVFPKVFAPVCDDCHGPGGAESGHPLTNYQEIYGPTSGPNAGVEVEAILTQVFETCSMPPATAPVALDGIERQILLDWLACGAPDSPGLDAGSSD